MKDKIIELGLDYTIIEHDHKYLVTRDPSYYRETDYVAPEGDLRNVNFYNNANAILCQSALHAEIIFSNLKLDTIFNVGGNLWKKETLDLLETLIDSAKKENTASIMRSDTIHKNTKGAIEFCQKKDIDFVLLEPQSHESFLKEMSENDTFVFFPLTVETLSRIVVEARMMGCKVKTNTNIGAATEPWFQLNGKELIDAMREKRNFIPEMIENIFSE